MLKEATIASSKMKDKKSHNTNKSKKSHSPFVSNHTVFFDDTDETIMPFAPYDDVDINDDDYPISDHTPKKSTLDMIYHDEYGHYDTKEDCVRDDVNTERLSAITPSPTAREGLSAIIHDQLPTIEEARTYASTLRLQERRHSHSMKTQLGRATSKDDLDVQLEGTSLVYNNPASSKFLVCTPRRIMKNLQSCLFCFCTLGSIGLILFLIQRGRHYDGVGDMYTSDDSPYNVKKRVSSRLLEVIDFLSTSQYSKYQDLITIGTPQQLACEWIADYDTRNLPIVNTTDFIQRYAMAVFYFSFNGNGWPEPLRFLSHDNVCSWSNVGYDELQNPIDVGASCLGTSDIKQLVFPPHYLIGTFPDELRLLSSLERISIFNNPGVTGTFPTVFGQLPHLNYLSLNYCSFNGKLPPDTFERLSPELTTLMLSNNNFNGVFPPSIQRLTNLKALLLDDNHLVGDLNLLFSNLSKLEILILDDNFFHGDLHILLNNLPSLQVLDISNNEISSTLPAHLFSMENLTVVDLHENFIQGSLPRHIPDSNSLQFLALQDNHLTGSIPHSIGNLSRYLDHLDLSDNLLTGVFPTIMAQLRKLKYLFLANNPTLDEQPIPTFLKHLPLLQDLSLRNTNLTGRIPSWIGANHNSTDTTKKFGHLMNLILLDLHNNKLRGMIPSSLGGIPTLRFLLLDDNKLHGTIPPSLHSLSNLGVLLLEKNNLNGTADAICQRDAWLDIYNTYNNNTIHINDERSSSTNNNDDNHNVRLLRNYDVITSSQQDEEEKPESRREDPINSIMSSPISIFITDCGKRDNGREPPEVTCECCTTCCNDDDENCNDFVTLGDVDPVWERGYIRTFYDLGYITVSLTP